MKLSTAIMVVLGISSTILATFECRADVATQHDFQPAFVLGPGFISCQKWTGDLALDGRERIEDRAWVDGYISGFNTFDSNSKRPFLSQDEPVIVASIDRFCKNAPDQLVIEEVTHLARSAIIKK